MWRGENWYSHSSSWLLFLALWYTTKSIYILSPNFHSTYQPIYQEKKPWIFRNQNMLFHSKTVFQHDVYQYHVNLFTEADILLFIVWGTTNIIFTFPKIFHKQMWVITAQIMKEDRSKLCVFFIWRLHLLWTALLNFPEKWRWSLTLSSPRPWPGLLHFPRNHYKFDTLYFSQYYSFFLFCKDDPFWCDKNLTYR